MNVPRMEAIPVCTSKPIEVRGLFMLLWSEPIKGGRRCCRWPLVEKSLFLRLCWYGIECILPLCCSFSLKKKKVPETPWSFRTMRHFTLEYESKWRMCQDTCDFFFFYLAKVGLIEGKKITWCHCIHIEARYIRQGNCFRTNSVVLVLPS